MATDRQQVDVQLVSSPNTAGTIADLELFFARRALARLKERLGREALRDILAPDWKEGMQYWNEVVAASDGEWQAATTELRVTGMKAGQLMSWFGANLANEPVMLAAQPEHYVIAHDEGHGSTEVIENIGPRVSRFFLVMMTDGEDADDSERLPDYPIRMEGHILADPASTTKLGRVLHQLRDTDAGFDAHLTIYFPAAMDEEAVEGHRRHLAVEWANWAKAAGAAAE